MNTRNIILFYLEKTAEDAMTQANIDLEEWRGREFYDDYNVIEAVPLNQVTGADNRLESERADYKQRREHALHTLSMWQYEYLPESGREAADNKKTIGRAMIRLGNMFAQHFCADMPYFNILDWDYSIPGALPQGENLKKWWAVEVYFAW